MSSLSGFPADRAVMSRYTPEEAETRRLLVDWWGKCRTCHYWTGDPAYRPGAGLSEGRCLATDSPFFGMGTTTTSEGYCPKWDPSDVDAAFEVMEIDEAAPKGMPTQWPWENEP